MTADGKLGPNDLVPCPSESARKRHAAKAELCPSCEPGIERPGICPVCNDRTLIVGDRYEDHAVDAGVWCPGSGTAAPDEQAEGTCPVCVGRAPVDEDGLIAGHCQWSWSDGKLVVTDRPCPGEGERPEFEA